MPEEQTKPKYQIIYEDLMTDIRNGNFSYNKVFCTEKQIAEKYAVSRITAKRAITDLEQIGILYRKRGIGSFVVAHNANAPADTPQTRPPKSKMVSFLLPFDTAKGGILEAVTSANQRLNEAGYLMSIFISDRSSTREKANLKLLLSQNPSGLIYYPYRDKINLKLLNDFLFAQIPIVVVDKTIDCPYINNITIDNTDGARLLVEHLIQLGHQNIAFLASAPLEETSSTRYRFGGYFETLKANGITPQSQYYFNTLRSIEEGEADNPSSLFCQAVARLYQAGATAIFCENDALAAHTIRACRSLGLSIPEEISICGFDNTSAALENDLTTINQDFSLIGEKASELLLAHLQNPFLSPQQIILPATLVARGSTGKNPISQKGVPG